MITLIPNYCTAVETIRPIQTIQRLVQPVCRTVQTFKEAEISI